AGAVVAAGIRMRCEAGAAGRGAAVADALLVGDEDAERVPGRRAAGRIDRADRRAAVRVVAPGRRMHGDARAVRGARLRRRRCRQQHREQRSEATETRGSDDGSHGGKKVRRNGLRVGSGAAKAVPFTKKTAPWSEDQGAGGIGGPSRVREGGDRAGQIPTSIRGRRPTRRGGWRGRPRWWCRRRSGRRPRCPRHRGAWRGPPRSPSRRG
ncbi:MAG: hypothetical protein RI967_1716, partial [Planctomycetota bacterium]